MRNLEASLKLEDTARHLTVILTMKVAWKGEAGQHSKALAPKVRKHPGKVSWIQVYSTLQINAFQWWSYCVCDECFLFSFI